MQTTAIEVEKRQAQSFDVCVVGAGMIFQQYHLPAILKNKQLRLVAVVDTNTELAESVAKRLKVRVFRSVEEVPRANICFVATPPHVRNQVILPAFEKGMHVFCEKPLSFTLDEARQLLAAAAAADRKIFVAHSRRFFPNVQMLRKFLRGGLIQPPMDIYLIEGGAYGWQSVSDDRAHVNPLDFGVIHDNGSHVVDLLVQMLDDLQVDPAQLHIEKSIFDRDVSPNNYMGFANWDTGSSSGRVTIKLSRSMNLHSRIIVASDRFTLSTSSMFDTKISLKMGGGTEVEIPVESRLSMLSSLHSAFTEEWNAVVADIQDGTESPAYVNVNADTVLPGVELISRLVSKRQIETFDPYFLKLGDKS